MATQTPKKVDNPAVAKDQKKEKKILSKEELLQKTVNDQAEKIKELEEKLKQEQQLKQNVITNFQYTLKKVQSTFGIIDGASDLLKDHIRTIGK